MMTYTKSSLPSLLAIALAGTLLTACGSDDKPSIHVDNTDVPDNGGDNGGDNNGGDNNGGDNNGGDNNGGDNNGGDNNGGDNTPVNIALSVIPSEVQFPKYEDGTYSVSKYNTYSCFSWDEEGSDNFQEEIDNGTKRCGLLQYTITGDLVKLSKVSPDTPVTVDYKLTSPTGNVADILEDPSMVSGTIKLHQDNVQEMLNIGLKTDGKKTGNWEIKLEISNPMGGANIDNINKPLLNSTIIDPQSADNAGEEPETPKEMGTINDTGVTFSGNLTKGNETTCATGVNDNQDCTTGRDATMNDDADGVAGFSFTKLDSNGEALAATASDWDCVKDNVTGNIWERKTYAPQIDGKYGAEGNANKDFRDADWDYSYYDASVSLGSATGGDTDCKLGDGVTCNTANYIAKMNSDTVCGISNWRLPSRIELLDLANLGGHESYQTMHANWLFTKNDANDEREWLNYKIPTQFWSSSVAASFDAHDGYSNPSSLKFNGIWVMFPDGSLDVEDPESTYSTAGILAVASTN